MLLFTPISRELLRPEWIMEEYPALETLKCRANKEQTLEFIHMITFNLH